MKDKELTIIEKNRKTFFKKAIAVAGLLMIIAIAVVLVILAVDKYKTEKYLESYGVTALEVGGNKVDFGTYRCLYLNYRDELWRNYTKDGKTDEAALDADIRSRIENDVRYYYSIISLAAEYGYSTESPDVIAAAETYISEMKNYFENTKNLGTTFKETLEDGYMTEETFTFFQRVMALEDVLNLALISDGGKIEDNDEKLREIFFSDDMIRVQSVFIENDKGEDIDENRRIAEEVSFKYRNGTPFSELISKYSEDYYADFYITRGEKIAVYDNAAFALEIGKDSGAVESEDGFYVIVRLEKDPAYIEENFDSLKSQYQYVRYNEIVEARMGSLSVIESAYVKSLSYGEIE